MNARDKLQAAYELAFFPPRLHKTWTNIRRNETVNPEITGELLKMALALHQALPEYGYASHRALKRLALYQANARLFGTVSFLKNILSYLGEEFTPPATGPPAMGARYRVARIQGARLTTHLRSSDFSRCDWLIVMDCDLQDRPEEIPRLWAKAQEDLMLWWVAGLNGRMAFVNVMHSLLFIGFLAI